MWCCSLKAAFMFCAPCVPHWVHFIPIKLLLYCPVSPELSSQYNPVLTLLRLRSTVQCRTKSGLNCFWANLPPIAHPRAKNDLGESLVCVMCDHDTESLIACWDELEAVEVWFPVLALVNTGWPGMVHWAVRHRVKQTDWDRQMDSRVKFS